MAACFLGEKRMKKKTAILIILAAAAAAALLIWRLGFAGHKTESVSVDAGYTVSVKELSGSSTLGAVNRFSGVVEAEKKWSVNKNPDSTVKEILVSVGDEVKAGDVLFVYDTEKYKSDQEQAEIDLERLNNELETLAQTIVQLQNEQRRASASEQADYTVRIQDAELQQKQKELDVRSKEIDIRKLKENQEHASVTSEIDGVVNAVNDGESGNSSTDDGFITIMNTEDMRIKGTVNEQNIGQIVKGSEIIAYSRVDEKQTWRGTVTEVNTESTVNNQGSYYFGNSDSGSSNYYFYVSLESSDGLMLGQHVYLEENLGQMDTEDAEGLWIPSVYVTEEGGKTYVLAQDASGKIEKREVTTGETDEGLMTVQITDGLTEEDVIALPENLETVEGDGT